MSRFAIFQKKKPLMNELHQTSGWVGVLAVIFHMTLFWRDRFVPYEISEIFVPFSSEFAPLDLCDWDHFLLSIFNCYRNIRFFDEEVRETLEENPYSCDSCMDIDGPAWSFNWNGFGSSRGLPFCMAGEYFLSSPY